MLSVKTQICCLGARSSCVDCRIGEYLARIHDLYVPFGRMEQHWNAGSGADRKAIMQHRPHDPSLLTSTYLAMEFGMVPPEGLEPPTIGLEDHRSILLSYGGAPTSGAGIQSLSLAPLIPLLWGEAVVMDPSAQPDAWTNLSAALAVSGLMSPG